MRIVLGGEGPTELGGWADQPPYRDPLNAGVIEALLRKVSSGTVAIEEGVCWKNIRKYRSGDHRTAEQRNVLGLAQLAREHGFDVLVFTRDRDRSRDREAEIEAALQLTAEWMPDLRVVGGVAVEAIEAFVLALLGDGRAEDHADPKAQLATRGVVSVEQKVSVVEESAVTNASGAPHLELWLDRARAVFAS